MDSTTLVIFVLSIANLITIEQARLPGVKISYRDRARLGVPVTRVSLAILAARIAIIL